MPKPSAKKPPKSKAKLSLKKNGKKPRADNTNLDRERKWLDSRFLNKDTANKTPPSSNATLKQYLDSRGFRYDWVAKQLGMTYGAFWRFLQGRILSLSEAHGKAIEKLTNGDWMPVPIPETFHGNFRGRYWLIPKEEASKHGR